MSGFRWACCLAAVLVGGCDRGPSRGTAAKPARPNIVFVMIDTLRADRVGCYGSRRSLTPALNEIAAEGVVFKRATSQAPWTQPSMASLYTSRYPTVHGVGLRYFDKGADGAARTEVLSANWTTLAEALRRGGYATAAVIANPWTLRSNGFAQGFDHYDEENAANETDGAVINEKVRQWIGERDAARPFFLFVHYMDVHGPYWAPAELLDPLLKEVEQLKRRQRLAGAQRELGYLDDATGRYAETVRHSALADTKEYWIARYESGVRYVDRHVGELRAVLRKAGVWENALVVMTADHGEELLDHARWNHGHTLYEEQLHVPLLMRWRGVLGAGDRVAERVELIDVMPTLLELAGVDGPTGMQGASMAGLLEGQRWDGTAFAEAAKTGDLRAAYDGDLKLIDFGPRGGRAVYDLSKDRRELDPMPVAQANNGEALSRLMDRIGGENNRLAAGKTVETIELSAEQRERLKALGYAR